MLQDGVAKLLRGNGDHMARIPKIEKKEELSPEHHPIYHSIVKSRGQIQGPFTLLLHSPEVAVRTAHLGAYIRFESQLNPKDAELAAMVVGRELECQHVWAAHCAHARNLGVAEEVITAIRERTMSTAVTADEERLIRYVKELLHSHRISDGNFKRMLDRYGVEKLVELTATVGYYAMLACTLNAFEFESDIAEAQIR